MAELKEGGERLLASHPMGPVGPGVLKSHLLRTAEGSKGPLPRLPASWLLVEKGNLKAQGKSEMRSLPLKRRAGSNTVLRGQKT